MRALTLDHDGTLVRTTRPDPPLTRPDDVRVRVVQTGICGTDRGVLTGKFPAEAGVVMGHEAVGRVESTGPDSRLAPGDRVVINPTLYCSDCDQCAAARFQHCVNKAGTEVGLDRDGSFADYIVLPERFVHPLPEDMSWNRAVVVEPLACVLNNLDAASVVPGEAVTILGAGPIGLVTAMAALHLGSGVVLVETDPLRRELAGKILHDLPVSAPLTVTDPDGAVLAPRSRTVVDTVGSLLDTALELVDIAGTVVIMGFDDRSRVTVQPLDILRRGLRIVGAGDYNAPSFPRALALAEHLPLERVVTHRIPLDEYERALEVIGVTGDGYRGAKVVIVSDDEQ
ncbi:zinc-dependent alcohol dehydrogenase [Streptomyces zaomyceticus]|uniref:zinc-dependent alcohol dehydrogenase n=1 Tax=Streptomyces zaomyceticus TaxID=68286 RepID=UPI00343CC421